MRKNNTIIQDVAISERVIFFDGVCNFCSFWVKFVIRRDPKGLFRFAPLQSPLGLEAARALKLPEDPPSSVILREDGRYYTRSTASFRIMRRLAWPWPLLYVLILIPAPLRDLGYKLIAGNRYRLFGKEESCFIPTPEIRSRFLS